MLKTLWKDRLFVLTLSHIQMFSDAPATDFWKHCGKWRNCSSWAISPFATMFSTLFNNLVFLYSYFPLFCIDVFKVICCRFAVCGKELRNSFWGFSQCFHLCIRYNWLSDSYIDVLTADCFNRFSTQIKFWQKNGTFM